MDSSLMYRGLPGGPTKIKFAEELPRHCLCGHCGMITLSMYQDPDNHMFCDDCLLEQSTKHGVYHIFCSYESRNIAIHEMFEARDLITIIRDQYVECPNKPHCKEYMPLRNLREHYVSCKKLVECPSCGESIETEKWNGHRCPLENEQAVSKAKEKNGASMKLVQDPESKGNQKRLVLHPPQTHFETRAYRRHCDRQALNIYTSPSETLGQAEPAVPRREWQVTCDTRGTAPSVQNSNGENHGPEATSLCQYCQRKVKEINMQRHLNNCTKAPKPCVYCDKMILPETMQMHFHECDRNPDNIPQTASEVNDHALVTADVPHEVKGHRQQQDRTGAERNCSPLVADVPVLPVLDVSHAELLEWYIAVQKHLRQLGVFDDTEKFELVSSFLSHCVLNQLADVLTSPPPTHAYECLLIALFRRSKSARSGCEDAFSCDQFLEELPYELAIKLLECEAAMEYIATSSVTVEESGCGSNDREMLFGDADTYFH